ncbi:MAG: TonB family protein, partial [Saprospiraceae bacterium]|nr:TonB family protein [Saprospiraceae bacterium]
MGITLLKLTLCWGFFAAFYHLLLRKETFFNANRVYLLATAVLGFLLAFWPETSLPTPIIIEETTLLLLPEVHVGMQHAETLAGQLPSYDWVWILYLLGMGITAARTAVGLFRIVQLARSGTRRPLDSGCILVESSAVQVPFSFFRWVFIPAASTDSSIPMMVTHERAHVHGWHSADVMFAEVLCIVGWFHPLAHWYRRTLRTVHEYIADASVSVKSDKKQYGLLLISQAQSGMQLALVNHFFQSPLKQRIVMLMKSSSSPFRAIKFALALPMVLLFMMVFRQTPIQAQTADKDAPAEFKGGVGPLSEYLSTQIQYPVSAKAANAQGTVFVAFLVKKDGSIADAEVLKGKPELHPDLAAEALRVVKAMPNWVPAVKNGEIAESKVTLPIKFKLDDEKAVEMFDIVAPPQFPGGEHALIEYLANNIKYPEDARKKGIEGMVIVHFVVEKDGTLSSFS